MHCVWPITTDGDTVAGQHSMLFILCWEKGVILQNLCNAVIVSLYKNKGEKSESSNYQSITLFSFSVKILAGVLESQCSFQANRGTADMIFVLRQLQKKCREQNMGLHAAFIDMMKAYDTARQDGLWKILIKLGCMSKFLTVLSSCTKDRKDR